MFPLVGSFGTNFDEIWIKIYIIYIQFLKMTGIWRPFCLGLNVLNPFKTMKSWVWLYRHYLTYVYQWMHAFIGNSATWFTCFILYIFSFPTPLTNLCCHKRGYYCAMWIENKWRGTSTLEGFSLHSVLVYFCISWIQTFWTWTWAWTQNHQFRDLSAFGLNFILVMHYLCYR